MLCFGFCSRATPVSLLSRPSGLRSTAISEGGRPTLRLLLLTAAAPCCVPSQCSAGVSPVADYLSGRHELSDNSNSVRKLGQTLSVGSRMRQYLRHPWSLGREKAGRGRRMCHAATSASLSVPATHTASICLRPAQPPDTRRPEERYAAGTAPSRGTTPARRRHSARICQSWLDPPVAGHWMTEAPSAVEASLTSAHRPLRTLTSWW